VHDEWNVQNKKKDHWEEVRLIWRVWTFSIQKPEIDRSRFVKCDNADAP